MIVVVGSSGIRTAVAAVGSNGTVTGTVTNSVGGGAIAGGLVELLSSGSVVATAIPNGSGVYTFSNVTPGSYTVTNQPPLAYSVADAGTFSISVSSGGTTTQDLSVQAALYSSNLQYANYTALTADLFTGTNMDNGGVSFPVDGTETLDANAGPAGTDKAWAYNWTGDPTGTGISFIGQAPRFNPPPALTEFWALWYGKYSDPFTHGNQTLSGSSNEYKNFLIQFVSASGTANGQLGSYLESSFTGAGDYGDPTKIRVDLADNQGHLQQPGSVALGSSTAWAGIWNSWAFGITGLCSANCVATLYRDGLIIQQLSAMSFMTGTSMGGAGSLIQIFVGGQMNRPPQVNQNRYWRQIAFYKSRPWLRAGVAV